MQVTQITQSPNKLDSGQTGKRAYVQFMVTGAGTLFYGSALAEIQSSATDPTQLKGLQQVQADGIRTFWWTGALWVASNSPLTLTWDIKYY
jgi:hypothetical protein